MLNNIINRGRHTQTQRQSPPQNQEATVEQKAGKLIADAVGDKETLTENDFTQLFNHLKNWMVKAEEKGVNSSERARITEEVNSQIVSKYLLVHQQRGDIAAFQKNLDTYQQGIQNFLKEQVQQQEERYQSISGSDILTIHGLNQDLISATVSSLQEASQSLPSENSSNKSEFTDSEQKQILENIIATAKNSLSPESTDEENLLAFNETLKQGITKNADGLNKELVQSFLNDIEKNGKIIETTNQMLTMSDKQLIAVNSADDKDFVLKRLSKLESNYEQSSLSLVSNQGADALKDVQERAHVLAKEIPNIKGKDVEETQELIHEYIENIKIYDQNGGEQKLNQEKTEVAKDYLKLSSAKALKNKDSMKASKDALNLQELIGYLLGGVAIMTLFQSLFRNSSEYMDTGQLSANAQLGGNAKLNAQGFQRKPNMLKNFATIGAIGLMAKESGILGSQGKAFINDFIELGSSDKARKKAPPQKVNA